MRLYIAHLIYTYNNALFTAALTTAMNTPARAKVMFTGLSWSLHVTTVPFNMVSGVAVTLRVDVRSASGGVGFAASEMRVAVKIPRSIGRSKGSFSKYLTGLLNAVLLHSRLTPPTTVHVRITSSPRHMPPRALEVNVTTSSEYQHNTIQGSVTCMHVYMSM